MSYCVHCGVELAASEKNCPLCNTIVIDPSAIESSEPIRYPYPAEVEGPRVSFCRITATFFSLFLVIPLLAILIADVSTSGSFSWSLIAAGGIVLFFMLFLFPNLFHKPILWMFLLFDVAAVILYLFVLCAVLKKNWPCWNRQVKKLRKI